MIYMVIHEDTHCDDEYHLYHDLNEALNKAISLVAQERERYAARCDDGVYETDAIVCDGKDGWWFSEGSLCGSWYVFVREVRCPA